LAEFASVLNSPFSGEMPPSSSQRRLSLVFGFLHHFFFRSFFPLSLACFQEVAASPSKSF